MPGNMFTPRPYQIELVERALKRNTIACLNSTAAKSFVWITYLKEILGHNFRVSLDAGRETNAFVLFHSDYLVHQHGLMLHTHLDMTILSLLNEKGVYLSASDWKSTLASNKIIITTPKVMASALVHSLLDFTLVGVLVLDECQDVVKEDSDYRKIVQVLHEKNCKPYILALTCSLLKVDSSALQLENDINLMECLLGSKAETATDLIALDGCSPSQPDEKIVLCGPKKAVLGEEDLALDPGRLSAEIRDILLPAIQWLKICKITPETAIIMAERLSLAVEKESENHKSSNNYGDGDCFYEIVEGEHLDQCCNKKEVPGPKPTLENLDIVGLVNMSLTVLSQVVLVLDVLGLWCAHRLVILLLKQLQKNVAVQNSLADCKDAPAKLKYFLLRYTDSQLRTIYTLCQTHLGTQKKVNLQLVTPKVDRLLQVLKEYKPPPEPEKKGDNLKMPRYNDRSEASYVSWWQDSDAEEDEEEEQMMNRGKDKDWNKKEENSSAGSVRAKQYHHANTLCGIVFVKEKYVALMLQRLLREIGKEDSDLWHVSSAHITSLGSVQAGTNILEKEDAARDTSGSPASPARLKHEEILRSFRSHEINLLVSTNCLEEYAEIPKCNLVLRFDVPMTYRSYVLSKSRARSSNSAYMMLLHEREKSDFMLRLQEYKKIEKVLQDSTCENKASKTPPVDFDYLDIREDDSNNDDELAKAPPYYSGPNTFVTMDSAIHVVNRYCSRLPSDPFTYLSARCEVVEVSGGPEHFGDPLYDASIDKAYEGVLQLPVNAHVCNPIRGVSMSTALRAQKAVALEACKVLHKAGELDDHFMPIGKEMVKYAEELDSWPDEKSKAPGRPGTTKRRQTYLKETPAALSGCLPRPDIPLFLYEIKMKLKTQLPEGLNVRRRRLHAPEETTRCFGILTAKPLPSILGFPIFTRSGEESVSIRLCRSYISLGDHHIKMIRSFHHYVFSDMLRIDKVPLAFRPDTAAMQIFVVILDKPNPASDLDLDWKFMCRVTTKRRIESRMQSDPWFRHRLLEAKGGKNVFVFKRSKYEDGVVIAKYRSPDQPNRFYVAEIKDELNPYSRFPSSEYESFHHYYRIKYGLDISCLNQPLLDVDHTSSRLNLLTPRYMNQKGKVLPVSSLEKKRAKYETLTNRQILVPELCDLHPIPASLWRKAVCIPSIIYRLSSLLLAEELRRKVYDESRIGLRELPIGQNWPDLSFGWENVEDEMDAGAVDHFSDRNREGEIDRSNGCVNEESSNASAISENRGKIDSGNETAAYSSEICQEPETVDKNACTDKISEEQTVAQDNSDEAEHVNLESKTSDAVMNLGDGGQGDENVISSDSDFDYESDELQSHFSSPDGEGGKIKQKANEKERICGPAQSDAFSFGFIPRQVLQEVATISPDFPKLNSPSPSLILQALTLSNASDGFNLERLEMLGDSFLKHAVTVYLFCTYPDAHEGKLSYMRSKKVSNYNLYRIGQQRNIPGKMTALIFDPAVNWLPPGYVVGSGTQAKDVDNVFYKDSRCDSLDDEMEIGVWTGVPGQKTFVAQSENVSNKKSTNKSSAKLDPLENEPNNTEEQNVEEDEIFDEDEIEMIDNMLGGCLLSGTNGLRGVPHDRRENGFSSASSRSMQFVDRNAVIRNEVQSQEDQPTEFVIDTWTPVDSDGKPLCASDPLLIDLHTQHSLADKSVADSVEAILGAYLTTCLHRSAQLLLCYFGLKVLPCVAQESTRFPTYGHLKSPTNVLLDESPAGRRKLKLFAQDLTAFEKKINYTFRNKAYLLQAFSHASYYLNTITDCYQRLEFLGDAILDFLITCRLFDDPARRHSPGALTDLRSALVNNTIFASLAVRHDFHKYFKAVSPDLHHIIDGFVRYQHLQEEAQGMDAQLAKSCPPTLDHADIGDLEDIAVSFPDASVEQDDAEEEEEDVEVPKALGDIFESVAGAIYMDSGMNLDEVWRVYEPMMGPLIEKFSSCVPRAPVRELLEMEPETAKFSWAEKRCDGKVRVTVEVIGKGSFKGVGRSYRIAKSAAARRALRYLKGQVDQ